MENLTSLAARIPNCVAAGLGSASGTVQHRYASAPAYAETLELAAAACVDLFGTRSEAPIRRFLTSALGDDQVQADEIVLVAERFVYAYIPVHGNPETVLIVIVEGLSTMGLVMAWARLAMASL